MENPALKGVLIKYIIKTEFSPSRRVTMDLKKDVIPVTELKNRTKQILERVARTGEPILVTQNGRSAVFIVDVASYQAQQKRLFLLEEIAKGEKEILSGKGISHSEALRRMKSW